VCGELAEAVAGRVARISSDEIVVFDSSGIAVGDLAICALLLEVTAPAMKRPEALA
jgi:ornithine cyclodeaminase/alanine dehydrogenase-like protein (mu-crystallin family)